MTTPIKFIIGRHPLLSRVSYIYIYVAYARLVGCGAATDFHSLSDLSEDNTNNRKSWLEEKKSFMASEVTEMKHLVSMHANLS